MPGTSANFQPVPERYFLHSLRLLIAELPTNTSFPTFLALPQSMMLSQASLEVSRYTTQTKL